MTGNCHEKSKTYCFDRMLRVIATPSQSSRTEVWIEKKNCKTVIAENYCAHRISLHERFLSIWLRHITQNRGTNLRIHRPLTLETSVSSQSVTNEFENASSSRFECVSLPSSYVAVVRSHFEPRSRACLTFRFGFIQIHSNGKQTVSIETSFSVNCKQFAVPEQSLYCILRNFSFHLWIRLFEQFHYEPARKTWEDMLNGSVARSFGFKVGFGLPSPCFHCLASHIAWFQYLKKEDLERVHRKVMLDRRKKSPQSAVAVAEKRDACTSTDRPKAAKKNAARVARSKSRAQVRPRKAMEKYRSGERETNGTIKPKRINSAVPEEALRERLSFHEKGIAAMLDEIM